MIYSSQIKYLFLETPHTGSTAISAELVENYGGESILSKHSNYCDFKREFRSAVDDLFVFSAVRHPLQEVHSIFQKYLSNHKGNYTNENLRIENGGWISRKKGGIYQFVQDNRDFEAFVLKYYSRPFTSAISINGSYCDVVLRFENLQQDFSSVLDRLGLAQVRPLPVVNKTLHGFSETEVTPTSLSEAAIRPFLPFMKEWGYMAASVGSYDINWRLALGYEIAKGLRCLHALTLNRMDSRLARTIRTRFE